MTVLFWPYMASEESLLRILFMSQLWPAAHNVHLAAAWAEHQYNFHTHSGSTHIEVRARFMLWLDWHCPSAIMLSWMLLLIMSSWHYILLKQTPLHPCRAMRGVVLHHGFCSLQSVIHSMLSLFKYSFMAVSMQFQACM